MRTISLLRGSRQWERSENPGAIGPGEFSADPASSLYREELDPHRRVIVYCASGSRAALSADTLRRMDYENVAHIDGG